MDRAEALVRQMEEEGIDAPIDIYHTMMDGYTMIGDEDKCLLVFERFKVQFHFIVLFIYLGGILVCNVQTSHCFSFDICKIFIIFVVLIYTYFFRLSFIDKLTVVNSINLRVNKIKE